MLKDVIAAKPLEGYRLYLRFEDDMAGEVDVASLVTFDGVFAPLADKDYFDRVEVVADAGTVVWPNGADLDPDVLYAIVSGEPLPDLTPTWSTTSG